MQLSTSTSSSLSFSLSSSKYNARSSLRPTKGTEKSKVCCAILSHRALELHTVLATSSASWYEPGCQVEPLAALHTPPAFIVVGCRGHVKRSVRCAFAAAPWPSRRVGLSAVLCAMMCTPHQRREAGQTVRLLGGARTTNAGSLPAVRLAVRVSEWDSAPVVQVMRRTLTAPLHRRQARWSTPAGAGRPKTAG